MLQYNEANNSQLFRQLSKQEQESIAAGQDSGFFSKADFFLQKTNIQTEAENQVNLGVESSIQTAKYNLSQLTLGTSITFRWPSVDFTIDKWNRWMNNLFKDVFK